MSPRRFSAKNKTARPVLLIVAAAVYDTDDQAIGDCLGEADREIYGHNRRAAANKQWAKRL